MKNLTLLFILIIFFACQKKTEVLHTDESRSHFVKDTLKYAKGFSIEREGKIIHLTVNYPYQGASHGYSYVLVPKGEPTPPHSPDEKIIHIPIETIACTSTTHIPLLDYLNETDRLVGFPSTDLISSDKMRARIDQGLVKDLGMDKGLNLELLIALHPSVLMGYTMNADYGQFKKVEELGVPVIINAEYLEKHPLGRAEWIKFVALFFNKEPEADSIFRAIEKNYLSIKAKASASNTRPSVLCGILYGDAWFLPGGQNYGSAILRDAKCNYLWAADSTVGYLELGFESVYSKARESDLWIGVATYSSLRDLDNADHRYKLFKPFKTKKVYNYDKRMGAKGGNEFLELGYLRPDLILDDLVKIAHPEISENDELFFYRKLD